MKRLSYLLLFTFIGLSFFSCTKTEMQPVNLNFNYDWQFFKNNDTLENVPMNARWEKVVLPHTANLEPLTVNNQWQGICFYKKDFTLDKAWRSRAITLQFDAAMNVAEVWVNGHKMIKHLGGYLPFVINLDSVVRFDTINTILVRLDNRDNPVTGPKPLKILDFNTYGGLYRDVHLFVKNKIHITNPILANVVAGGGVFFATIRATKEQAGFEIKTQVSNETNNSAKIRVKQQLIDTSGKAVVVLKSETQVLEAHKAMELKQQGDVNSPLLWSPENPNLYQLKTEVYADGKLTDEQTNTVGLRFIEIKPDGLWLNGQKTFLRGVNRHQEYPYIGYALSDAAQYRDAYKIKQAGFDYVRSSHYPMSPAFLDACDKLGIMVLDAILGWQYFGNNDFEQHALRSSHELIRRDRNHPCVLAWELSINETWMPEPFIDSAQIIAHQEYPYADCYSAGWMRYGYDIYIEARQHRHKLYPEKPLIVSEYGDWEYFAQNAGFNQENWDNLLDEERNSRQPRFAGEKRLLQQALNIQEAHNDNLSTHAFADGYWVMFDYNRGTATDQEYSGVMDIFRLPKFSYYFFKSQRDVSSDQKFSEPMIDIASYWQPGVSNSVRVFSNCSEVELFVDGQSIGKQKPDENAFTTHLKHPPFTFNIACTQPGQIKAVGYIGGKPVANDSVSTPGAANHITLQLDESGKKPEKNDVIFIYANINDADNNPVFNDSTAVTFSITGAQLARPATIKAQAGIASALIHTGILPADVMIKVSAQGLKSDSISFQIH